jgi:hypothetical protein
VVLVACLRRRNREGGERKGAGSIGDVFHRSGGRQGKEGGGSGAESAWKRETDGERGCPSAAAGTGPWPTDAGGRRACVTGTETGEGGG